MLPDISIIIPLFNEEDNVAPLAGQVLAALRDERRPLEVVLVDDASTDGTWEQIMAAHRADPGSADSAIPAMPVKAPRSGPVFGTAVRPSLSRWMATCKMIPRIFHACLAGLDQHDVVCGMRTKRQDNFLRRISSKIARAARKSILGVDFRIPAAGSALSNVQCWRVCSRLMAFTGSCRCWRIPPERA